MHLSSRLTRDRTTLLRHNTGFENDLMACLLSNFFFFFFRDDEYTETGLTNKRNTSSAYLSSMLLVGSRAEYIQFVNIRHHNHFAFRRWLRCVCCFFARFRGRIPGSSASSWCFRFDGGSFSGLWFSLDPFVSSISFDPSSSLGENWRLVCLTGIDAFGDGKYLLIPLQHEGLARVIR